MARARETAELFAAPFEGRGGEGEGRGGNPS